jgi:cyclohexyl-isocyanide hydratase
MQSAITTSSEQPIQIGAIVFPDIDQIDLTGPFAVLSRLPNSSFQLLWKNTNPVRDHKGLYLLPDVSLVDIKLLDLLVVPGGPGQEALMEDTQVLSFLTTQAERAKYVFSVCTGTLLCGAAGLLKGRSATTHWQSVQFLKYFGAVPKEQRVVIDGTFVSAAGLTAGIDGALQVAALLRGEEVAQAIQLDIQYAPEPPFGSGTPARAPTEIVAKLKQISEQLTAQRLATARRVAAKLGVQVDN